MTEDEEEDYFRINTAGGSVSSHDSEVGTYCGASFEEILCEFEDEFGHDLNVTFFILPEQELELNIEYLLPRVVPEIPPSDDYWPNNMAEFKGHCILAVTNRNSRN